MQQPDRVIVPVGTASVWSRDDGVTSEVSLLAHLLTWSEARSEAGKMSVVVGANYLVNQRSIVMLYYDDAAKGQADLTPERGRRR